ncbi:hypothetical protein PFISCL1PPCAC_23278, partial [Pristionchus fissidentatus]
PGSDIKGPFTEQLVQEWYRQRWFCNDFLFFFMDDDENPDEKSTAFTLGSHKNIFVKNYIL